MSQFNSSGKRPFNDSGSYGAPEKRHKPGPRPAQFNPNLGQQQNQNSQFGHNTNFNPASATIMPATVNSFGGGLQQPHSFQQQPQQQQHSTRQNHSSKQRPDEMELKLLTNSSNAGVVIGKAGAAITLLREETKCRVHIAEDVSGSSERIIAVVGAPGQVAVCIARIAKRIADNEQHASSSKSVITVGGGLPAELDVLMLVERKFVGAVIGKGGSSIKLTRSQTGADIRISNDSLGQSTEKTIRIRGSADAVTPALETIVFQLADDGYQSAERPYTPSKPEPHSAHGQFSGGMYGAPQNFSVPMNSFQPTGNFRGNGRQNNHGMGMGMGMNSFSMPQQIGMGAMGMPNNGFGMFPVGGRQQQMGGAQGAAPSYTKMPGPMSAYRQQQMPSHMGGGGMGQGMGGGGRTVQDIASTLTNAPGLYDADGKLKAQATVVLPIPNSLCGGIIGKGGAQIEQIRQQSGASVSVAKRDGAQLERMVTIEGTGQAAALAISLVQVAILNQGPQN